MPAHNENGTVQSSLASGKKAYQAPRLCCYGNVGDITQAVASNTKTSDGGMGSTNKTG